MQFTSQMHQYFTTYCKSAELQQKHFFTLVTRKKYLNPPSSDEYQRDLLRAVAVKNYKETVIV